MTFKKTAFALAGVLVCTTLFPSLANAAGIIAGADSPGRVPGRYFVVFKQDPALTSASTDHGARANHIAGYARMVLRGSGAEVIRGFGSVLNGVVVRMPEALAERVARDPRVEYVEQVQQVELAASGDTVSQTPLSGGQWGLDRIDQTCALPGGAGCSPNEFRYTADGSGIRVYVVDVGFGAYNHPTQWDGRAVNLPGYQRSLDCSTPSDGPGGGKCIMPNGWPCKIPQADLPDSGHGYHVAGIVGSKDYGVAKNAQIRSAPALCLDDSGTARGLVDDTVAAIDSAVADLNNTSGALYGLPGVINLSIRFAGDSSSRTIRQAVQCATQGLQCNAGFNGTMRATVVAAAGNFYDPGFTSRDSCLASESVVAGTEIEGQLTVGASNNSDNRWSGSFMGACTDVFAPGEGILSLSFSYLNPGIATGTGTSMAAPFVTGRVAQYLELHPGKTPAEVEAYIKSTATPVSALTTGALAGTPNKLLFAGPLTSSLGKPTGLQITSQSASGGTGSVTLNWTGGGGIHYQLFESNNDPLFRNLRLVQSCDTSQPQCTVNGLVLDTTYYYRVRRCNDQYKDCSFYTEPLAVTVAAPTPVPGTPNTLTAAQTCPGPTVTASWTPANDGIPVSSYVLEREVSGSWNSEYSGSATQDPTPYSAIGGTSQELRVKACNNFGTCSAYKTFTYSATTCSSVPMTPVLSDTDGGWSTDGQYTVNWTSSGTSNITYTLQRRPWNGTWTTIYTGTGNSKAESFGNNGIKYYQIKACFTSSPTTCSAYSTPYHEVETDFGQ